MAFCVYKHTSPSNKVYIGISGIDPKKRWNYGHGYCYNPHFYNAIKKYGWHSFAHEILFDDLTQEEAENIERTLIKETKSYLKENGYNQDMGGSGVNKASISTRLKQSKAAKKRVGEKNTFYGKRHTDETKRKISELKSGIPMLREWVEKSAKARQIRVYQKDLDGNIINEFESIIAAAEAIGAFPQNIQRVCKKRRPTCRGFIWDYVDYCRADRSKTAQ